MSYEDVVCPACECVGKNVVVEDWLVCQCGEDLMEVVK